MNEKDKPLDLATLQHFTLHSPLVRSIDVEILAPDGVFYNPDLPEMADDHRMVQFRKAGILTLADLERALNYHRNAIISYATADGRRKLIRKGHCYIALVKAIYGAMESREDTVKGFQDVYYNCVTVSDSYIEMWRALARGDESWKELRKSALS